MSETEKKVWPCSHISKIEENIFAYVTQAHPIPKSEFFCSFCGAQRPEERDELDEIFDKHRSKYKSGKEWQQEISKDLRAWKEKSSIFS